MTTQNTPLFQAEVNGYNRQQVDMLWTKMEEQYKDLYEQWKALSEQNASLTREAAALLTTNSQLTAEVQRKSLENENLSQRIQTLASAPPTAAGHGETPILKEMMDIILRHATEIIAEAKDEAEAIRQKAASEHPSAPGAASSACADFQPSRAS